MKLTTSAFLAVLALSLAACSSPLTQPGTTAAAAQNPARQGTQVAVSLAGAPGSRSLIDGSVAKIHITAFDSTTTVLTGSGDLAYHSDTKTWNGDITVKSTGAQVFYASALGTNGKELYFGENSLTVGGKSNSLTITLGTGALRVWTDLSTSTPSVADRSWNALAMDASGTKVVAATGSSGDLWRSSNGGTTWTDLSTGANAGTAGQDWTGVASSADGTKLVACAGYQGLWTSSDSGTTWVDSSKLAGNSAATGFNWSAVASSADGSTLVAVATSHGDIWTSVDSGTTWTDASLLSANAATKEKNWTGVCASADGKKLAAVAYQGDIWTSSDSGATWTDVSSAEANSTTRALEWSTIACSADGTRLTAAVNGVDPGDLWTSSNSGATWTNVSLLAANSATVSQRWTQVVSNADGSRLAAATDKQDLWTSDDGGQTWTDSSTALKDVPLYALASDSTGLRLVAGGWTGSLWSGLYQD